VQCWLAVRLEEELYLALTCLAEDLYLLDEAEGENSRSLPIPGGGPIPGGVPLWPGKAPNPGGRPNGDAVHVSKLRIKYASSTRLPTSIRIVRHPGCSISS
jgi:hypothetical protein